MSVKRRIVSIFLFCGSFLFLSGCTEIMQNLVPRRDPPPPVEITKPDEAYVSPNLDFNQISALGIFPIFPGEIQNDVFADAFSRVLNAELQTKQSQWKIILPSELVGQINQKGFGRGYKNLQADMNTFSGATGFGAMTQETKNFLQDLDNVTGANSYLLGVYSIRREKKIERSVFGPMEITFIVCKVKIILYQINKGIMWDATHTVETESNIENNADVLGKAFASYLGKGTLRQL